MYKIRITRKLEGRGKSDNRCTVSRAEQLRCYRRMYVFFHLWDIAQYRVVPRALIAPEIRLLIYCSYKTTSDGLLHWKMQFSQSLIVKLFAQFSKLFMYVGQF